MIIGYIDNFNKPHKLATLIAKICKGYGIELFFIRPEDIDKENYRAKGRFFIDNQWVWGDNALPEIIDLRPYYLKREDRHIIPFLEKNRILTDYGRNFITKEKLQELMPEDEELAFLSIPTQSITRFEDIVSFIEEHHKGIVKPIHSLRGKGIYLISKYTKYFKVEHYKEEYTFTKEEFLEFYKSKIKGKKHILQKYIKSRTTQGDPFDCRVHVEKNGLGNWELAKKYVRIGIGQRVISNVNQGGGISETQPFLKANFGDSWRRINRQLNEIAKIVPARLEKLSNTTTTALGLDIGISNDGKLYMFEANVGPAYNAAIAEIASLRADYYLYLSKQIKS